MQTKREQLTEVLSKLEDEMVKIVTVTSQDALKKSRETGLPTPQELTTIKKYAVRENQFIGSNYEKMVKKMRFSEAGFLGKVKKFICGDKFEAQGTYTFAVTKNGAVLEHKTTHKQYLRTLSVIDAPVDSHYYDMNNDDITELFKDLQKNYFSLPSKNKSQGLENPLRVNNTTLTNIKYIEVEDTGEVLYNELSDHTLRKLELR